MGILSAEEGREKLIKVYSSYEQALEAIYYWTQNEFIDEDEFETLIDLAIKKRRPTRAHAP